MKKTIFSKTSVIVASFVVAVATAVGLTAYAVADGAELTASGVSLTSPINGAVLERNSITVIAAETSNEVVVTSIAISVDGEKICSGGASDSISCEWKVPSRMDAYTISVVAVDSQGDVHTDAVTVTVECSLKTVNEKAKGDAAKTVTVCLPEAAS